MEMCNFACSREPNCISTEFVLIRRLVYSSGLPRLVMQTQDHPLKLLYVCSCPWKVCKGYWGPELPWGGGPILGLDLLLEESARNKKSAACIIKWIEITRKHLQYLYLQDIFQQNENARHNVVATYQNQLGSCNIIIFSYRCVNFVCLWGGKLSYDIVAKNTYICVLWTFYCWNFTAYIFTLWFTESGFLSDHNVNIYGYFFLKLFVSKLYEVLWLQLFC